MISSYTMRYHDSIEIHIFFIIQQNDTVEKYRERERERERERVDIRAAALRN